MDERAGTIREMLLVCIGPSPTSARVIRRSQRMAFSLNAHWVAASVETRQTSELDPVERHQLMENIHLARRLGAEVVSLSGQDVAEGIISYARSRAVTRIVIGKSGGRRWRRLLRRSVVERLLRLSGDIDIYVVQSTGAPDKRSSRSRQGRATWRGYSGALGAVVVACLIALLLEEAGLSEANRAVVFIPAVVAAAISWGLGPGVLAAVASVLAFDFFFVPPRFTFAVQDIQYVVTLIVMAAVALLVGTLAARLRRQMESVRARERRLEALYRLTRGLSGVSGVDQILRVAETEVGGVFESPVAIYLPRSDQTLEERVQNHEVAPTIDLEREAAAWAFRHGEPAGRGTHALFEAASLHTPMITAHGTVGVLSVEAPEDVLISLENQQLLEAAATQIGIAIERDMLAETSQKAVLEAETERMRSSLLSSVSHDLRTPLAVISGTASTLLQLGERGDNETKAGLATEVYEESNRLTRLVENLLAMTRLDSGEIKVAKEWFPVEDVVGSALGRLRKVNQSRVIQKHWSEGLPLVQFDGVMIDQVLFNLLENAVKYSKPDSPIDLFISSNSEELKIEVADRGPGLAEGEADTIFEKLYRGSASADAARGAGLGLAIARAIVRAHGGEIWAANRPDGGAVFSFTLPLGSPPCDLEPGEEARIERD